MITPRVDATPVARSMAENLRRSRILRHHLSREGRIPEDVVSVEVVIFGTTISTGVVATVEPLTPIGIRGVDHEKEDNQKAAHPYGWLLFKL